MPSIAIDYDRCQSHALCVAVCPLHLITLDDEGRPMLFARAENDCTNCGHCVAYCPSGAISVDGVSSEALPEVPKNLGFDAQKLHLWISGRRSTRNYAKCSVPQASIERCIQTAEYAPSGRNLQPVRWMVFREAAVRDLVTLCRDFLRSRNIYPEIVAALDHGQEVLFHGAPVVVLAYSTPQAYDAVTDGVIALTCFEFAAHAEGLGTCWSGLLKYAYDGYETLRRFINIPEGHTYAGAVMVGYPEVRPLRLPARQHRPPVWR